MLSKDFLDKYSGITPPWGFNGLGEIVYLRTYSRKIDSLNRNETWIETLKRVVDGVIQIGTPYTKEECESLFDHMFYLRCSVSGRALWQLGTPLVEKFGGASLNNCYYTNIESIEGFEFLFVHSMLGGGVGFSVERSKIHDLPKVKSVKKIVAERSTDADFIVPDSRHGWQYLLRKVLKSYFVTGKSFTYSTILIRGYGAELKTFGGTASGPEVLVDGISDICNIFNNRVGKKLRSIDVLDICNLIGKIVVAGSSRRSAQIAIGDPDDTLFLRAKNWGMGNIPSWRGNSNNSIYADSFDEIPDEFWRGYDGSGEPYGLLNRKLARSDGRLGEKKPDTSVEGFNPCSEIALADGESCNLATLFLPNIKSKEQFKEISILLYKLQKQITTLKYPFEKTNEINKKNARLGQSITGILQCEKEKIEWLNECYEHLKKYDLKYSKENGFNPSIRLTAIQPSGTLSLLPGVTPGIHPAFAPFYIRRVRFGSEDKLVESCRKRGYKVCWDKGLDGREDHTRYVVEFPCKSPANSFLANKLSAVQQLEWVKQMQTLWADNAISVTVYYRPEELSEIKEWLKKNYKNNVKSISFLLYSDHNFPLPPYEEITEEEYNKILSKIDFNSPLQALPSDEVVDYGECATGICPIK